MSRTSFANDVCKLLFNAYIGDFENEKFIKEIKKFDNHLDEYIRNFYECVDDVPLIQYIHYVKYYNQEDDIYTERFHGNGIVDKEEILKLLQKECYELYHE